MEAKSMKEFIDKHKDRGTRKGKRMFGWFVMSKAS